MNDQLLYLQLFKGIVESDAERVLNALRAGAQPNRVDLYDMVLQSKEFVDYHEYISCSMKIDTVPFLLHIAIFKGCCEEICQALIDAGADVNAVSPSFDDEGEIIPGETPLHVAANAGKANIAILLIENKAEVDSTKSEYGWTPLCHAIDKGHLDVVETLVQRGANLNLITSNIEYTPVMKLLDSRGENMRNSRNKKMMFKFLMENGADINIQNSDGISALHLACKNEYSHALVSECLSFGADVSKTSRFYNFKKPIDLAIEHGEYGFNTALKALLNYYQKNQINLPMDNYSERKRQAIQTASHELLIEKLKIRETTSTVYLSHAKNGNGFFSQLPADICKDIAALSADGKLINNQESREIVSRSFRLL